MHEVWPSPPGEWLEPKPKPEPKPEPKPAPRSQGGGLLPARIKLDGAWAAVRLQRFDKVAMSLTWRGAPVEEGAEVNVRVRVEAPAPAVIHLRGEVTSVARQGDVNNAEVTIKVIASAEGRGTLEAFALQTMRRPRTNPTCYQIQGRWMSYRFDLERQISTGVTYKRSRRAR